MLVRRSSFSLAVAVILVLGLGMAVRAQTLDQRVVPNPSADALTAALDGDSRMDVFTFSETAGISTGTLTIIVQDGRGTNTGWNVTLASGDFVPVSGDAPVIPARGFQVVSDGGITAGIGGIDGISVVNTGVPLDTGTRILQAGTGAGTGEYAQRLNVQLDIPAWQPIGEYRSEVTVTIAAGPGDTGAHTTGQ